MKTTLATTTLFASLMLAALGVSSAARADANEGWHHPHHAPVQQQNMEWRRDVNERQQFLRMRIESARERGFLTGREFRQLQADLREIRQMERHFLADGRLSRMEYARLDRALDNARHEIRSEARDSQTRKLVRAPYYGHGDHDYN